MKKENTVWTCPVPTSEKNLLPSLCVVKDPSQGVTSQMNVQSKDPVYNGKTLDTLRDESSLNRLGKIEQMAQAEKIVAENIKVYKKSAFATHFAKAIQSLTTKNKKV